MISEFLLDNESFSQNSLARSFLICALIFVGDFLRASVAGFFRQLLQTLLSSLPCVSFLTTLKPASLVLFMITWITVDYVLVIK